jgi:hypothetical protein
MTPTSCGQTLSDCKSSRSSALSLSITMTTSGTPRSQHPPPQELEQGPMALCVVR